jgi:hypothetical protein
MKVPPRPPVAVRLAGGGDFDNVTAGKPDCYRSETGQSLSIRECLRVSFMNT